MFPNWAKIVFSLCKEKSCKETVQEQCWNFLWHKHFALTTEKAYNIAMERFLAQLTQLAGKILAWLGYAFHEVWIFFTPEKLLMPGQCTSLNTSWSAPNCTYRFSKVQQNGTKHLGLLAILWFWSFSQNLGGFLCFCLFVLETQCNARFVQQILLFSMISIFCSSFCSIEISLSDQWNDIFSLFRIAFYQTLFRAWLQGKISTDQSTK